MPAFDTGACDANALEASAIGAALDREGFARLPGLLDAATCNTLIAGYADDRLYRSTITMARHGFGQGEYRYFAYPLPPVIARLRSALYAPLAAIASQWNARIGIDQPDWPTEHAKLIARCAAAGQMRPTPLILRYRPGDHNRLHQDVYGDLTFPLQVIVQLSAPGVDFAGGELVLVEGRARMQSRPIVVPLKQGDAVVIPVRERPVASARGWARAAMRHGVATVTAGERHSLGIIFHDAR
ncbi:2OG-Fe(II) oxygenase [Sphingobium algorifonticola]|uniref:Proline hydroxylase n=1 Tax=Sphingobium algorifonticola TaxID=2008318 RepID=A0A437JDG5_9SPHN|nr:2OG-Fe(II) oxygenase [Sphingobium algorifonticola]RVT43783.1 proline hydroxylase [Sphingobium algorifonticola]